MSVTTGTVPAKIVMKGTAQMSLNARFSRYSAEKLQEDTKPDIVALYPPINRNNTKLAMDMERRPNVLAALKYERSYQEKSVMQRLGAKSRLGFQGGGIRKWRRGYGRRRFQWRYGNFVRNKFGGRGGGGGRGGIGWGSFGMGYRGRGRGFHFRGRRFWGQPGRSIMKISKEELDKQLEEYMVHSKNHLDTDLDNYMAQINLPS